MHLRNRGLAMFKNIAIFTIFLVLLVFAFLFGGHWKQVKIDVKHCVSASKLAQIRYLLLKYHENHGEFPPAQYQPDPNGPVHSWRVLLVPYTEEKSSKRYQKYDFSQEWKSPNNLRALGDMPTFSWFNCGDDNVIANYLTVGDGEDWPIKNEWSSGGPRLALLVTKGNDRFLVFEDPDSKIHWMEPKN